MPPASIWTSTSPGPQSGSGCSSTRRSLAAWMVSVFMVLSHDRGGQGLACKMRRQVVAHQLAHGLARLARAAGVVRLQQDVVKIEKAWIKRGFPGKDVKRR